MEGWSLYRHRGSYEVSDRLVVWIWVWRDDDCGRERGVVMEVIREMEAEQENRHEYLLSSKTEWR